LDDFSTWSNFIFAICRNILLRMREKHVENDQNEINAALNE
jgi:hypothetical protein